MTMLLPSSLILWLTITNLRTHSCYRRDHSRLKSSSPLLDLQP